MIVLCAETLTGLQILRKPFAINILTIFIALGSGFGVVNYDTYPGCSS